MDSDNPSATLYLNDLMAIKNDPAKEPMIDILVILRHFNEVGVKPGELSEKIKTLEGALWHNAPFRGFKL